ncbi:hypothetical protein [Desulfovibrio sp. ZJ200]|uniref:hypothetical protein n=1 Tax=Desulfovibrio sp. ZJ200 TaxID=2709792 RepID=UPI0013EA937A|nr:hypothetical protein [Desulfovibrio sp. ZJ200]
MKHFRLLLGFSLLATLLLTACGPSNNVRLLSPPPLDAAVLPAPNAPRVSVVAFADKRGDQTTLGVRRDKSAFVTGDDVAQWVSRALADELARNGLQVSYAATVAQARSGNPDYLVTGQLDEAWLREPSTTELSTGLRVNYVLANRQGRILHETLNSGQSRTGLPSGSAAENLLLETLRDLVKPMTRKIVQAIEAKK